MNREINIERRGVSLKGILATFFVILLLMGVSCGAFRYGYHNGYEKGQNKAIEGLKEKSDTIYRFDTLTLEKPVYLTSCIVDTLFVRVDSIIVRHDTSYVSLLKEERVYEKPEYRAVVSGYQPSLDSIEIRNRTELVKVPVDVYVKKRFGFSVTAGPSVLITPAGDLKGGLGITAGVSYTF